MQSPDYQIIHRPILVGVYDSTGMMLMRRPWAPWFSNRTRPWAFAKIVLSLPMPAFRPGPTLRPRCRTMIVPLVTRLPSCAFVPRRCEF